MLEPAHAAGGQRTRRAMIDEGWIQESEVIRVDQQGEDIAGRPGDVQLESELEPAVRHQRGRPEWLVGRAGG